MLGSAEPEGQEKDVHVTTQNPFPDEAFSLEIDQSKLACDLPHCQWLSNGTLSALITAAGAGYVRWHDLAITRWRADRVTEAYGSFFYLRDLESGKYWSVGYQPTRQTPVQYTFRAAMGATELSRSDDQIESCLQTTIASDADVLLRRLTITNHSSRSRHLELTSYEELVLQAPSAFEGHPAFSKLFIKTDFHAPLGAIVAQRRLRTADEQFPTYLTFVAYENGKQPNVTSQCETDRTRFLGRNQSLASPLAMEAEQLSGTVGSVLDPIASLRATIELSAGESRSVTFVSCLHWERTEVVKLSRTNCCRCDRDR